MSIIHDPNVRRRPNAEQWPVVQRWRIPWQVLVSVSDGHRVKNHQVFGECLCAMKFWYLYYTIYLLDFELCISKWLGILEESLDFSSKSGWE